MAEAPRRATSGHRRTPAVDDTTMWDAAMILERVLGSGFHLSHTHHMGWLLRHLESWPQPDGIPRSVYVDVDSAPDGQLGALLIRHQRRVRGG